MKRGALLLMGGEGGRFGAAIPKQFGFLFDKRLYRYPLETIEKSALFDLICLVVHPEWVDVVRGEVDSSIFILEGGKTRQESSCKGLQFLEGKVDLVLIHDAVRPFVSRRVVEENLLKGELFGAVDTCLPSYDTIVIGDGMEVQKIPPRSSFFRGQTPQTFHLAKVLQAHRQAVGGEATDDCQLVLRAGYPVAMVLGEEENFKITTPFDWKIAEELLRARLEV